jgi:hypothetical protein
MYIIQDKNKAKVAWLRNNIIISIYDEKVIGVTLGHCVFSVNGELIGKIFNNKFFLSTGKIIGTVINLPVEYEFNELTTLNDAWKIISKIKEHQCIWINETQVWDTSNFFDHFH